MKFKRVNGEFDLLGKEETIISIIVNAKTVSSKSEARRLFKQGAVKLNSEKVSDPFLLIKSNKNSIIKIGKRKFLKVN